MATFADFQYLSKNVVSEEFIVEIIYVIVYSYYIYFYDIQDIIYS